MISPTATMDPSYITHQRRFALIPKSTNLSAKDEQSVWIRTGDIIPATSTAFSTPQIHSKQNSSLINDVTTPAKDVNERKRKASTTAEEHQAATLHSEGVEPQLKNGRNRGEELGVLTSGDAMRETCWFVLHGQSDLSGTGNGFAVKNCCDIPACEASPKTAFATSL
jgi:hypothetical protein